MKQNIYDELQEEFEKEGITNLEEAFDCEVEVYDKITTDYFVTHKLKEE